MIIKVEKSPLRIKRFRAFVKMHNGEIKHFDFGAPSPPAETYIDHFDVIKRENYRIRHLANATERKLIQNLVPSPSVLSFYLLWGKYTKLEDNIKYLNTLFRQRHTA